MTSEDQQVMERQLPLNQCPEYQTIKHRQLSPEHKAIGPTGH